MAQHVRGDAFGCEGRAAAGRAGGVLGEQFADRVVAERLSVAGWEHRIGGRAFAFVEPVVERLGGLCLQRRGAFLPAFPDHVNVRGGVDGHVRDAQRSELGHAQAGRDHGQDQRVVAASEPGGPVRRGEERVDLGLGEVGDVGAVIAFGRDLDHASDRRGVFGVPEGRVAAERVDRGESRVAGPGGVAAVCLEVVEERADQWRVEIVEVKLGWLFADLSGGERE